MVAATVCRERFIGETLGSLLPRTSCSSFRLRFVSIKLRPFNTWIVMSAGGGLLPFLVTCVIRTGSRILVIDVMSLIYITVGK